MKNPLKPSASTVLMTAAHACKWNDTGRLTAVCGHLITIVPELDLEKLLDTTLIWQKDSNLPLDLVIRALCMMIDETEAWPNFKGKKFVEYIDGVVKASGAEIHDEGQVETPTKTKPRKKKAPQKFPAGTETKEVILPEIKESDPMLVGTSLFIDTSWFNDMKISLCRSEPFGEVSIGGVVCSLQQKLNDNDTLVAEVINAKPSPVLSLRVIGTKDGKPVASLPPIRTYDGKVAFTYKNVVYNILPLSNAPITTNTVPF